MKATENLNETLNKDFSSLTDENKQRVLEMTKFLILTEKTILPEMLKTTSKESEKKT